MRSIISNLSQLLDSCTSPRNVILCTQIHSKIIALGVEHDSFLVTKLISVYSQCGNLNSAITIFSQFSNCNIYILNSMIRAFALNGLYQEAINLFSFKRKCGIDPDSYTFSCIFKACAFLSDLYTGKCLHQLAVICGLGSDVFVSNSLINMYAKCGSLDNCIKVFDRMPHRDKVSWNSIINAYISSEFKFDCFDKLREMVKVGLKLDEATILSVLSMNYIDETVVREMHGYVLRNGLYFVTTILTALISSYGKCNLVKEASSLFDGSDFKDRVSWNAMISCYARNCYFKESIELLKEMKLNGYEVDVVSYSGIISSLSQNEFSLEAMQLFQELLESGLKPDIIAIASILPSIPRLNHCKEIHAYSYRYALEFDRRIRNGLIFVYCKCGLVKDAEIVFQKIHNRDVISWSSMVAGYTQNNYFVKAIDKFREMVRAETEPNPITMTSVLSSCTGISSLRSGKEIHAWVTKKHLESQTFVGSALVDMYAKCGEIADSRRVFDLMNEKNLVSWNSIISGYGMHGLCQNALELFYKLEEPDDISFIAVLSACNHGGLVDEGIKIFNSMENFNVKAREVHYACVVDMLARSGRIEEALEIVKSMPMVASDEMWGVLLGASKMHFELEVGLFSSAKIMESGRSNSGYYVSLSNMYANRGMWNEVEEMREIMKEKGVKKVAGCSLIELNNRFHCFVAKERAQHDEWDEIYRVLCLLNEQMKDDNF